MSQITVTADGPLHCTGAIEVSSPSGQLLKSDQELWFCRCGASKDKPYCDGSHKSVAFKDGGTPPVGELSVLRAGGLSVTPRIDGPLKIRGSLEILDATGKTVWRGSDTALCRCGASTMKPFCDGSHRQIGFKAE